jgi:hypothetical protein
MNGNNNALGRARGVQLCSAAGKSIAIDGQVFTPDKFTAYVEFYLSHAFPVYLDVPERGETPDKTTIHPQTIANSYRSLRGKCLNLAHLMVFNNPDEVVADKILGTVMAVEFPPTPEGGWKVQGEPALAPGIRAVAALHKNAVGVPQVIDTWAKGKTPFSQTQWTVSMENEAFIDQGGFLVKGSGVLDLGSWEEVTPEDFKALGWIYVPYGEAPVELKGCLKTGEEGFGMKADYAGCNTLFLNGGLNGEIFYYGVALTPVGKESHARVARINASAAAGLGLGSGVPGLGGENPVAVGLRIVGEFLGKVETI